MRLAVLGFPVSHSRSPAMHNAALAELGLDDWSYETIEVAPGGLEALVRELPGRGFAGVNVTVPHKVAALALADRLSDAARAIGATNTLNFAGGEVHAENTDGAGILAALPQRSTGERALVLGAGGAARAAVWALREAGAQVAVWNRSPERAAALAREFAVEHLPDVRGARFGLIVNATTVGLGAANSPDGGQHPGATGDPDLKTLPFDADAIPAEVVLDLVYGSQETQLVRAARAAGATVVDGIEVLVQQGAASLRLWTGHEPPLETMRAAARSG